VVLMTDGQNQSAPACSDNGFYYLGLGFIMLPALTNNVFTHTITWPIRKGTTYKGKPEVVLPNGKPCE
jgi:hypothetical protein